MDPNETLRRALDAKQRYEQATPGSSQEADAAMDLADAFGDLHTWLSRGGFLPAAWANGRQ